jgi:hypothetical protein
VTISNKMMLTDAGSLPRYQIEASVPGMAHFAGTGPGNATCGDCSFWRMIPRTSKMHCEKYVELTKDKKPKPVPSLTWACRYFVRR